MKLKDRKYNKEDTLFKTLHMSPKHTRMICATITSVPKNFSVKKVSSNKPKDDFKKIKKL